MRFDNQEELFDVVDKHDRVIGQATRSEVHSNKNLIHRAITVLVFNYNDQLLLQKRSKKKDTYSGYWTSSCTGHVGKGNSYKQTALRELREELGILIQTTPTFLFKKLFVYPEETEYMSVYRLRTDQVINFNHNEISEGKFFELNNVFFNNTLTKMKITPDLEYIFKLYLNNQYGKSKINNT